ncbi:MAG: hypothetical protein LBD92_02320 [Oscillospiraceae bacterium]|jgi:glycerophosphoryl diester phosphodiesterase|nr:hypothetical protein [Oscillospiraceae bacterium]
MNGILLLTIVLSVSIAPLSAKHRPAPGGASPDGKPSGLQIRCVRHAGGVTPDGTASTNALEAIDRSYADGDYFLELDFNWTSDGELVCIHDWHSQFSENIRDCEPLSLREFENIKIYGKYRPLTLASLARWLADHPKAYIITDIKRNPVEGHAKIAREYPGLIDRFIPQIYFFDEYDPVRGQGYQNIILTLYAMSSADKLNSRLLVKFARERPLFALTFDKTLATGSYVAELLDAGIPLYTHTVNDPDEIRRHLAMGVTGVYSDFSQNHIFR